MRKKSISITLISDTHTKHGVLSLDLPGGDILIHTGDIMNSGYNIPDISAFAKWFEDTPYTHKVFIEIAKENYFPLGSK